jgi:hypothetical protein
MNRAYTDFLVPDTTFWTGAGAVFNLGGTFFAYNNSGAPAMADARAIRQDFAMVGQDILDVEAVVRGESAKQLSLDL